MKPPAGRFIDLPNPTEDFSEARLSQQPVTMDRNVLRLTRPKGGEWSELDTVIELTVQR